MEMPLPIVIEETQLGSDKMEACIIKQAIKRDHTAFTYLYDRYVRQVYRYVYFQVSDRVDAEDITQEVFIRAWKAIGKYRLTGAPFSAWLLTIARNLIADHYNKKKNTLPLEKAEMVSSPVELGPEHTTETMLERNWLKGLVQKLRGNKRKVILLRFIGGFSCQEIARLLNKSEGAVRVLQHRALSELRCLIGRDKTGNG